MSNNVKDFLVETSDNVDILTEETEQGKQLYITGIFAQANKKNGNGRIYEQKVMKSAVDKYNEQYVSKNRALGEINHPDRPFANPENAAIRITEMKMVGDDVYGKALVLNTPKGQIMKGLLEGGFSWGVSTRGLGSIEEKDGNKYVQDDFFMTAVDAVDNPSAPDAFVSGIMESSKWAINESTGAWFPVEDKSKTTKENEKLFLEKLKNILKESK